MKLTHKKTAISSIIAIVIGTSCCWLTTVAFWLGGLSIVTVVVEWIDLIDTYFIVLGVVLAFIALFLFARSKGCCPRLSLPR